MKPSFAIAVADDEVDMRDFYQRMLSHLGHRVIGVAKTGVELIAICRVRRPELIITDVTMPEMNGDDAVAEICREVPLPVILVTARADGPFVSRWENDHVMAYLIKPIGRKDLEAKIGTAVVRFERLRQIRDEAADHRQAADDRKTFEQAVAQLMKNDGIDEGQAYLRLQSKAAANNRRLVDAAREALSASEPRG